MIDRKDRLMDVKLEKLIEKIKKEGIEEAKKISDSIIKEAQKEATHIIEKANKEAEKIIKDGKTQVEKFQMNGEAALRQAARDSQLLVKQNLLYLFDRVFKKEVAKALKPEFLKELILKIVDKWADESNVEITINKEDKKKLEAVLFKQLRNELKDKIVIRVSTEISKGFYIGLKNNDIYYDFSDESIAEMLKMYINPGLKEILDAENG